jgi:hypothetical protein
MLYGSTVVCRSRPGFSAWGNAAQKLNEIFGGKNPATTAQLTDQRTAAR